MIDLISRLLGGLSESRTWASFLLTLLVVAIVFITAGILFPSSIPLMDVVQGLFAQASPSVQATALSVLLLFTALFLTGFILFATRRNQRVQELKSKIAQLESELESKSQELLELRRFRDNLLRLEEQEGMWKRPAPQAPHFLPRTHRKVRFVCLLNLKGGVGKTTLTANLAAYLNDERGQRILLVDLDFQGTLGNLVTDRILRGNQFKHRATVARLYEQPRLVTRPELLRPLLTPVPHLSNVYAILAPDILETQERRLYAEYLIESKDCRWIFRDIFHHEECRDDVLNYYDYVFFDCPPRITPSVINALACSDYVLIPTRLDKGSIDVVQRTIEWLGSLGTQYYAEVLGVVTISETRNGQLHKKMLENYKYLNEALNTLQLPGRLFEAVLSQSPYAVRGNEDMPFAALTERGRQIYRPVAEEFLRSVH